MNRVQLLPDILHTAIETVSRTHWCVVVVDVNPTSILYRLQDAHNALQIYLTISVVAVAEHESSVLRAGFLDLSVGKTQIFLLVFILGVHEVEENQPVRVLLE